MALFKNTFDNVLFVLNKFVALINPVDSKFVVVIPVLTLIVPVDIFVWMIFGIVELVPEIVPELKFVDTKLLIVEIGAYLGLNLKIVNTLSG